jgi:hypothetical protein
VKPYIHQGLSKVTKSAPHNFPKISNLNFDSFFNDENTQKSVTLAQQV